MVVLVGGLIFGCGPYFSSLASHTGKMDLFNGLHAQCQDSIDVGDPDTSDDSDTRQSNTWQLQLRRIWLDSLLPSVRMGSQLKTERQVESGGASAENH